MGVIPALPPKDNSDNYFGKFTINVVYVSCSFLPGFDDFNLLHYSYMLGYFRLSKAKVLAYFLYTHFSVKK